MFSQSLLFALWRETAAPPDSSASSHADTTPGSRPVSAARREANWRWSEVSIVPAAAGRVLALVAPVEPTALDSRLVKLVGESSVAAPDAEVPPVSPAEDRAEVPVPVPVAEEGTAGEKADWRLVSCPWICEICASTEES